MVVSTLNKLKGLKSMVAGLRSKPSGLKVIAAGSLHRANPATAIEDPSEGVMMW